MAHLIVVAGATGCKILVEAPMGPLPFYLLAKSLVYNAPLILVLWIARKWIGPTIASGLAAFGFASATAYTLWRLEWFDVWRHGMPGVRYLMFYIPYLIGAAALGWFVGRVVSRRPRLGVPSRSV